MTTPAPAVIEHHGDRRPSGNIASAVRWVLPRLALRAVLLIAVLFAAFAAVDRLPGNAALAILGRDATAADVAREERNLGLDRPVWVRFGEWLAHALSGDPGQSSRGVPISELLAARMPVTVITSGIAFVLVIVLSLLCGAWLHASRGSARGAAADAVAMGLLALPEFVVGTLLVGVFALGINVLPAVTVVDVSGRPATWDMYVLPVLALTVPQLAWNVRVVAAAFADAEAMPHVRAARLAGFPEKEVLRRHVLPPALPVIAASIATTAGLLFAGTVVVETLFNHPGVGELAALSIAGRDLPTLVTVTAMTGAVVLVLLTAADVVRTVFSPGGRP